MRLIKIFFYTLLLAMQYACTSTGTTVPNTMTPTTIPSITPSLTPTYTPTPTLSPFALATFRSTNYSIPTPPNEFPTPFPPETNQINQYYSMYKYDGTTIISGNNIITTWRTEKEGVQAVTITNKDNQRVIVESPRIELMKIFVGNPIVPDFQIPPSAPITSDLNNNGIDEIVISTHGGGNSCLHGLYIYELGDPPFLVADEVYCNFYWFNDLNNDKKLELLIQKDYLAHFSFMPWNIGGFIPVTKIFSYDPNKGYISSSCKFKDYYGMADENIIQDLNPEKDNDGIIALVISDYVMIGDIEKAKDIAIESLDGEKEIAALKAIESIHKSIQSDICP